VVIGLSADDLNSGVAHSVSPDRLLADVYDCETQKHLVDWGHERAWRTMLGRLRFDVFLYRKVIMPIGDFVDGAFFLQAAMGGSDLLSEIPWPHIEIRSPHESLEHALLLSIRPRMGDRLKRYWLSNLGDDNNKTFGDCLETAHGEEIPHWRAIIPMMERAGVSADATSIYGRAWEPLFSHVRAMPNLTKCWDNSNAFSFDDHFSHFMSEEERDCKDAVGTAEALEVLQKIGAFKSNRSAAWDELRRARARYGSEAHLADFETIENWYTAAYRRTQAKQNGCGSREFLSLRRGELLGFEKTVVESNRAAGVGEFEIPEDFLFSLGMMPADYFQVLLRRRDDSDLLHSWRRSLQAGALKQGTSLLVEAAAEFGEARRWEGAERGGSEFGAGMVAGVVGFEVEKMISKFLATRRFVLRQGGLLALSLGAGVEKVAEGAIEEKSMFDPAKRWRQAIAHMAEQSETTNRRVGATRG